MKVTNRQLKRIITEEVRKALYEEEVNWRDTPCKRVEDYYENFKPRSAYHKHGARAAQRIHKGDGAGAERELRGIVDLVKAMKKNRKPGVDAEKIQSEFWDYVLGTYRYIQDLGSDACIGVDLRKFPDIAGKKTGNKNVKDLLITLMPLGDPRGRS